MVDKRQKRGLGDKTQSSKTHLLWSTSNQAPPPKHPPTHEPIAELVHQRSNHLSVTPPAGDQALRHGTLMGNLKCLQ